MGSTKGTSVRGLVICWSARAVLILFTEALLIDAFDRFDESVDRLMLDCFHSTPVL